MSERLVVGIDVGSGSCKASVFDRLGRLHSVGRAAYEPTSPGPGIAEYDAVQVQEAAVEALAEAVRGVRAASVEAIAVDGMMSGAVPLDASGQPAAPYTTTLDTRFSCFLKEAQRARSARLHRLTGSIQATLGPKISWIERDFPEVAARTVKYTLAGGLVAARLAGLGAEEAFVDSTYLWTTGLADAASCTWSPELCVAQGVDEKLLPKIVACTDVIGEVSAETARLTGLRAGVPVIAGCGDQAAGYIGAGVAELGTAADSAGTYAVLAGVTAIFAPGTAHDAPDLIPAAEGSCYHAQVMVIGGGLTRQWACDLLRPRTDHPVVTTPDDTWADVSSMSPGARGVRFVPHFGGQAHPSRPGLRGAWLGLTWAHGPADLYTAVLESIALDHAHAISRMREQYSDITFRRVVGYGGGAQSAQWSQIKADALGVRYENLGDAPVAGLGVAMLAARAVGLVDNAAATAAKAVSPQRVFLPDKARHEAYQELLPDYLRAVALTSELS